MTDQPSPGASSPMSLPDAPNLDWLRKQAKRRLVELRQASPDARLADAQLDLARQYGFPSWRALKSHVDSLSVQGRLFDAARNGDVTQLVRLLDAHPDMLHARAGPYGFTLLHLAARHPGAVDLLLQRGLDVNARERGDNTYAMHWAAAAGELDVVRRLADAGGDVIGHGDDHELEVIGWATCWDGCDDAAHRAVADFLVSRGARHHVFSAIAMSLADEVRRIVAEDPSALNRRMSRNENNQLPLHFAVRMDRPEMVTLLVELGADPLGVDGSGYPAATYAMTPAIDRRVMEAIRRMTGGELVSAERAHRRPELRMLDLLAALALGDWEIASRMWGEQANGVPREQAYPGALHLMSKRGDVRAVNWLLERGADPNTRWAHWDADVTPLHLAALAGHTDVARVLLDHGADTGIRDSRHDSDALGWAEFFRRDGIVQLLRPRPRSG
jgi:ankyrin repeat protein